MMNDHGRRRPCGCGRPSYRPQPPPPLPAPDLPDCHRPPLTSPVGCSGYLMQRILASGTVHRRRACYPLNLNLLPQQTRMPFTVLNVICCALPTWEEIPYCDRQGLALRVSVPLSVQVRDADGCMYSVSTQIQEELILRFHCPTNECWRGQPMVQAAVRLAGRACTCTDTECEIPLEVFIEGYLVAPCAMGRPESPCPPQLPWYPEMCR